MHGSASTAPDSGAAPRGASPSGATASWWRYLGYGLGLLFVATGLMKLVGLSTELVPGAAMLAHPAWFRMVVGVAEIVCGALLFVPAGVTFGAVGLGLLMFGAMATRLVIGAPGAVYPAILLLLLIPVAWDHRPADVRAEIAGQLARSHPILRAGAIGGSLAAATIAVWFLLVDTIAGRPLETPLTLGRALLSVLGPAPTRDADLAVIAFYTVFHFAAFIAVALVAEWVVERARSQPAVLAGALMLFAALQVGIYGLVAVLQETTGLGALVWWQVMVGNLLATAVLGTYIWRHHVELGVGLRGALEGTV